MYRSYDVIDPRDCLHYRIIDDDFKEDFVISSNSWEQFLNGLISVYEKRGLNNQIELPWMGYDISNEAIQKYLVLA